MSVPRAAPIYLDANATAPVRPEVVAAVAAILTEPGNPSSVHRFGREARRQLERARAAVGRLAGAPPEAVLFTSGGTEANNQVLSGVDGSILISAIEHDSVLAAAPTAARIPVDPDGRIELAALRALLASVRPGLVSVMLANNETGVIQPVAAVAALARAHGALVHCDAVQAGGKLAIEIEALGVDFLTLSAHKLGGPPGVGALVLGPGIEPRPLLRGGGQERRWRPGTENLPGIVGFGRALELALDDRDWATRVGALRDLIEARITALAADAKILGRAAPRLANTTCVTMPGVGNQTQLIELDLAGVAVSTGSACSSGKVGPSHVLAAMGVPVDEAETAIRVSLSWASTEADVDHLVTAWSRLYARTRRSVDARPGVPA